MNTVTNERAVPTSPQPTSFQETTRWAIIRYCLVLWSVGIWALLILVPGIVQMSMGTLEALAMNVPYIFIGLGLVGAIFAAYKLRDDKHLFWFLSVLLLLAGWM